MPQIKGPLPKGLFPDNGTTNLWERCMTRGQRYRVVRRLFDLDSAMLATGAEWFFVGSYYVPYDDDLSVLIADDEWNEYQIQLQLNEVPDSFKDYVVAASGFREEYFATARCAECGSPLNRDLPDRCPKCHAVWTPA
jgi:hypothetical protein